jgi:hypothetical protein
MAENLFRLLSGEGGMAEKFTIAGVFFAPGASGGRKPVS